MKTVLYIVAGFFLLQFLSQQNSGGSLVPCTSCAGSPGAPAESSNAPATMLQTAPTVSNGVQVGPVSTVPTAILAKPFGGLAVGPIIAKYGLAS